MAYILHWFPEPTETFIFNEVVGLREMGLPIRVYTLYGELAANLSRDMLAARVPTLRLGIPAVAGIPSDLLFWKRRDPARFRQVCFRVLMRRWSDLENTAESWWAFFCGFLLARRFEEDAIEHIHAPWANGPATAAWVASLLTGIPFSFAVHATDIYPPDGALMEKIAASSFIRSENGANVDYLGTFDRTFLPKIHLVYSGHPIRSVGTAPVPMTPPYRILALGRLVPKKGFDVLIRACGVLKERGVDLRLVLGGSGRCHSDLKNLADRLGLGDRVEFRGFVPQHLVSDFLATGDVFVMPSVVDATGDRDGLPNVILEALLQGLPVVASDVCGIREAVRHSETGLLVRQGDPLDLADVIQEMLRDRGKALQMAEAGRAMVVREFDIQESCLKMLQLFQEHTPGPSKKPEASPHILETAFPNSTEGRHPGESRGPESLSGFRLSPE